MKKLISQFKSKGKNYKSLATRQSRYGRLFILSWQIGFVLFFLVPFFQSIWYSFSNATPLDEFTNLPAYIAEKFTGFENYNYLWNVQPDFTGNLWKSVSSFAYSLPIILLLSLVFALFLNQKFHGRLLARAVFFLPVIIATGAVISILSEDVIASQMLGSNESSGIYNAVNFSNLLMNMGLPEIITSQIAGYISSIFDLMWSSGVQTILFLAGLQSIPNSLYEVANVEGANSWEKFWFITAPMLTNVIVLNAIFTSIELFTSSTNPAMRQMYEFLTQGDYNASSAIVWSYCLIVGSIIGLLLLVTSRIVKRTSET